MTPGKTYRVYDAKPSYFDPSLTRECRMLAVGELVVCVEARGFMALVLTKDTPPVWIFQNVRLTEVPQ